MSGRTLGYKNISPQYMGAMCAEYRRYYCGCSQEDVANDVGCDRTAVSKFERGINCNGIIFLWYIKHGIFNWLKPERWNGWGDFNGL